MIRTAAFALVGLAVAAFALAQDSETPDFSDVDAALEALTATGAVPDASVAEATDEAAESADTETAGEGDLEPGDEAEVETTPLIESTWLQSGQAELRGLDKITGRSTDFTVTVGEPYIFGSLEITLATCFARPPEQAPEDAAFLTVAPQIPMETEADVEPISQLFSGWMFASSPGLNALEHPVYDVWVISCAGNDN